jgi:hypothetical protein
MGESMNAADLATEGLLSQEIESLAGCIARGQTPDTYQDIVEKVRGHVQKLPPERRAFWTEQVKTLGVVLFPPKPDPKKVDKKPGGASVP